MNSFTLPVEVVQKVMTMRFSWMRSSRDGQISGNNVRKITKISLVDKWFLLPAQKALYEKIDISNDQKYYSLITHFHRYPYLKKYVKEFSFIDLIMIGSVDSLLNQGFNLDSISLKTTELVDSSVRSEIAKNLKACSLRNVSSNTLLILNSLTNITTLTLSDVTLPTISLANSTAIFSHLTTLSLERVDNWNALEGAFSNIRALSISNYELISLLDKRNSEDNVGRLLEKFVALKVLAFVDVGNSRIIIKTLEKLPGQLRTIATISSLDTKKDWSRLIRFMSQRIESISFLKNFFVGCDTITAQEQGILETGMQAIAVRVVVCDERGFKLV